MKIRFPYKFLISIVVFFTTTAAWLVLGEKGLPYLLALSVDSDTVDVRDFGAIPDDEKDDTIAVRKALAKLPPTGGTVYFPEGTYLVSTTTLKSNTKLIGLNAILKAGSIQHTLVGIQGNNITIDGLVLDGDNKSVRGITIMGGSSDVTIKNSTVKNFTQPSEKTNSLYNTVPIGIRIEGNTSRITISSSKIMNVYAINIDKYWPHKVARGVLISPKNSKQSVSKDVTIENSYFYGIGPKDDGDGIVIQGWDEEANLRIVNNTFDRNHKRAVKIQTPGAVITGNTIHNPFKGDNQYDTYPGGTEYDMFSAISIYHDNVTVQNNTIDGVGSFAAAIDIANANNVTITGNDVSNGAEADLSVSDLIRVTSDAAIRNISITDNTLRNGRHGIRLITSIDQLTVQNNKIFNVTGR